MHKKQIALLVDHPENDFSIEICRGAKAAARQQDIELCILYGGYVTQNDQEYDYAIHLKDSKTGILIGNNVSEKSAKECFSRLTFSIIK